MVARPSLRNRDMINPYVNKLIYIKKHSLFLLNDELIPNQLLSYYPESVDLIWGRSLVVSSICCIIDKKLNKVSCRYFRKGRSKHSNVVIVIGTRNEKNYWNNKKNNPERVISSGSHRWPIYYYEVSGII